VNEIDPQLLSIFDAEQREHLRAIRGLLERRGAGPLEPAVADELLRRAHTLKGAARAVGIAGIEALAHRLESLFARSREGGSALEESARIWIRRAMEAAEDTVAALIQTGQEPDCSLVLAGFDGARGGGDPVPGGVEPPPAAGESKPPKPRAALPEMVRVSADSIDRLVRSSSQLVAAASGAAAVSRQLALLNARIAEIEKEWTRATLDVSAALRQASPGQPAAPETLGSLGGRIRRLARDTRESYNAQRRQLWRLQALSGNVHRQACRARMVPAEDVFEPFRRMVRDLAREQAREIGFHLDGGDVLADRLVLQALKDPVMHLLRNAVVHGIEPPEERAAAGKPRAGSLTLRIEPAADRLLVSVEDDGRGIDPARVAQAARRAGLLGAGEPAPEAWDDIAALLLRPGFSTSQRVTTLAGRGMGLCVVRDAIARLEGEVRIGPGDGAGTIFLLTVPLSISTHHVVLLRCGPHTFAIPNRGLEGLHCVDVRSIETAAGGEVVQARGRPAPLVRLGALLGVEDPGGAPPAEDRSRIHVAVVRAGAERLALAVDRLLDEREVIVRDLGLPGHMSGMSSGGVLLEDGAVAVVLDPASLIDAFHAAGPRLRARPLADAAVPRPRSILVVDDSITTRTLEKSILEAHGYKVRVAVDGLDALAQLRDAAADLVIADVSMPRMNGFELVDAMKKNPETASIPVIMVTSMESPEDQERGLALGADAYIIKRKFDQRELLETIEQIV
jgi:two-component system chemotaxis sensor kinase CheA